MRILYLTYHPNALSESYARTEIEWLMNKGIDVHLLSTAWHGKKSGYESPVKDISIGESLKSAISRVKPDIVHAQCLYTISRTYEHELENGVDVPVTIRGHSFDFQPDLAMRLAGIPSIKRIWLFPHFAKQCCHPKIFPLTSFFSDCYTPGKPTMPPRVVRVMAGVPSKNIDEWIQISELCPEVRFDLAMTTLVPPDDKYPEKVSTRLPANVKLHVNLQREEVMKLVGEACISMTTLPRHPFGMPISLCEAMATGLAIVAPDTKEARDYLEDAGHYYSSPEDAAKRIRELVAEAKTDKWEHTRRVSLIQATKYRADLVLPSVLETWKMLIRQSESHV